MFEKIREVWISNDLLKFIYHDMTLHWHTSFQFSPEGNLVFRLFIQSLSLISRDALDCPCTFSRIVTCTLSIECELELKCVATGLPLFRGSLSTPVFKRPFLSFWLSIRRGDIS